MIVVIFYVGVFMILCLMRIKQKTLRSISYFLMTFVFAIAVLKGFYEQTDLTDRTALSVVLTLTLIALIIHIVNWITKPPKKGSI